MHPPPGKVPAPVFSGSSNRASIGEVGQGAKRRLLQIRNSGAERGGGSDSTYEVRTKYARIRPSRLAPAYNFKHMTRGIFFEVRKAYCSAKHI
ncbi:hypothetical protein PoMZ_09970 [Pyricularia oryzae]|uniref:Uncharacterized protein n=1 Tax=Pyricularia oryzae TaxID=318829 RepID=A0A4P7N2X7_PYROR|nr:hypothetical protein PoMZ_09970 [Pyricularia oryzae]